MSAELLDLLDSDPAAGLFAAADHLEREAGRCAQAEGAFRWTDPKDGARLVEWMLAAARHWRTVAELHRNVGTGVDLCRRCVVGMNAVAWPCLDLTETADEAKAYLGGAA